MHEEEYTEPDFLKRNKTNPFRTPDFYFDSLEERIMGNIEYREKEKQKGHSSRVFQILKPVFGLAASFALVYLLVYYPINTFLIKDSAKIAITDSAVSDWSDVYSIFLSSMDENTVVNAISTDGTNNVYETNPEEVLAYLSSGPNDLEIYSEIQN